MQSLIRTFAPVAMTAALAVLAVPTAHAVPLLDTFGGPIGYGANVLPANDDSSSDPIDLTAAFPGGLTFFGGPYSQVWVNNNGNITFNDRLFTYTPNAFPVADQPMIAPYWGDVDTRGGGAPDNNGVFWHLQPGMMVVTWHNVGVYSQNDSVKMDFQLILRNALDCRAGDFDVEFRYNRCEWEAGRASGDSNNSGICDPDETTCVPAQAGFDAGNSVDFVAIPGSLTAAIRDVCTTSNVGMPGIWQFSVRGGMVDCPGTGTPCDTGEVGACGLGVTQCVGRDTVCSPIGTASGERCDGIDNDCDGTVDNGELCSAPEVCIRGACVPPCFEGGCGAGEECNGDGICVETACLDVTCPAGERCSGGTCVGACDGVSCPVGRQCVAGQCIDLCNVLTCEMGEVCVDGACVPQCPCRACGADEICGADGSCTPVGCDITICDPGFYCREGTCYDACEGAVCPAGQICTAGECVDGTAPTPDAGVSPGTDAGSVTPGTDAGTVAPGTDAGGMMGGMDAGGRTPPGSSSPGCACRVEPGQGLPAYGLLLAPLALFFWRRRR